MTTKQPAETDMLLPEPDAKHLKASEKQAEKARVDKEKADEKSQKEKEKADEKVRKGDEKIQKAEEKAWKEKEKDDEKARKEKEKEDEKARKAKAKPNSDEGGTNWTVDKTELLLQTLLGVENDKMYKALEMGPVHTFAGVHTSYFYLTVWYSETQTLLPL
jgi:ATPase subunit of ABC transporter with duplicated ATPase domains